MTRTAVDFHSPAYRADDMEAADVEYVYRNIIADHADMTIEGLLTRIKKCNAIALDGLTYGYHRSSLARRVAKHAEQTMKNKVLRMAA